MDIAGMAKGSETYSLYDHHKIYHRQVEVCRRDVSTRPSVETVWLSTGYARCTTQILAGYPIEGNRVWALTT